MADGLTTGNVDLAAIRVEQARLLRQGAVQSCMFVEGVALFYALMIGLSGHWGYASLWAFGSTAMVLVSFAHSRLAVTGEISAVNYQHYLSSHVIVCTITGLVWGGFAIALIDFDSAVSLFIACFMATAITLGGILPSSEYRPGFVALATANLIPLAGYILVWGEGTLRFIAVGILIYYAFCMYASARSEIDTRRGITAKTLNDLTQALLEKNAAIEKASEEKTRFLAATSHDMSQPLHAQGLFIRSLKKLISDPEQMDLLDKIERSWRNQSDILRGLVDVSKLDSGVIAPARRNMDLRAELNAVADEFAAAAEAKGVQFQSHFSGVQVNTDPVLLARIIRNLLSNALKFTPPGGVVDISTSHTESTVTVVIEDTGPGIPAHLQDKVFDEYFQIGNAHRDREQGLGLGLSIVRRLVELIGIDLDLSTAPDRGTCWRLSMPVGDASAKQGSAIMRPAKHLAGSPLVLVVDDEPDIRDGTTLLLTDWGCRVLTAATGTEAIDSLVAVNRTPQVLLVDKRLPHGENGTDLIHLIRDELNTDLPAILITGDINELCERSTEDSIHWITKPVDPDELFKVLHVLLFG
ncbi:MAG: ATP-binding protein [Pseudomonadota bacterium]